ncbi:MAG: hypothetical protein Q7S82_02975 [bacterium]|nr:hypothetical protein [bacterium]
MKWKEFKHILVARPNNLTSEEKKRGFKVLSIFLSIFDLLIFLIFLLFSSPKFEFLDVIILILLFFSVFTFLSVAFDKKLLNILRIFALSVFVLFIIYFSFSNPTLVAIGWLALAGWMAYFIREIVLLIKYL